jgi:succinate dehydrogenase / fumarate reductase membrane anchor subunit
MVDMAIGTRERGSIRSGLGEWVVQRVTAVYMLLYITDVMVLLVLSPVVSHSQWTSLSANLLFQVATLLFIYSMLIHAWLGLKSVMLDYVKPWRLRFLLYMLVAIILAGLGVWAFLVIVSL